MGATPAKTAEPYEHLAAVWRRSQGLTPEGEFWASFYQSDVDLASELAD